MSGLDFESGYLGAFVRKSGMTPHDLEMYAGRYKKNFAHATSECGQAPSVAQALRRAPYVHNIDAVWRPRHWAILVAIVLILLLTTSMLFRGVAAVAALRDGTWLTGMWISAFSFCLCWLLFLAVQAIELAADCGSTEARRCIALSSTCGFLIDRCSCICCWMCMARGELRQWLSANDNQDTSSDDDSIMDESVMRQDSDTIADFDDAEPDAENPQASLVVEREGAVGEGLFTCGLFVMFLQITLYMAAFAYYYPMLCPQERGPYSCSRMHKVIEFNNTGNTLLPPVIAQAHYYPPRFDAHNTHPPCENMTKISACEYNLGYPIEAFVPYAQEPPKIMGFHISGKEWFGICCHAMPLLFAALWLMELRRLTGRLVARAFELSGAERDMAENTNDEESRALRGRSILQFLAVVYHVILPHWRRSVLRLGTVMLDFVDAQDFFLLLLEFDVYEGKPINPDYNDLANLISCNYNTSAGGTVTCNCPDASGPPWWQKYSMQGFDPCTSLESAANEWWSGYNTVWVAEHRWFTWHLILAQFLIGSLCIYLWPVILYMRKYPPTCCRRAARRMGMRLTSTNWTERHEADNREAFWNALRSLFTIELPFLGLRMWASTNCSVMVSSLVIKNVLWAASDINTIVYYMVWSWSDLGTWPEFRKFDPDSRDENRTSAFLRWLCQFVLCCGWVPRKWWLQAMSHMSPKVFLVDAPANVPPAHIRRALGNKSKDADIQAEGYSEGTVHALKYNDVYIVFDENGVQSCGGDITVEQLDEHDYLTYDDFDVEKHTLHTWTRLFGMS